MSISVDTTLPLGPDGRPVYLTDLQEAKLKNLFRWILLKSQVREHPTGHRLRGSIIIPFKDGHAGDPKVESIHDLNANGKSEPGVLLDQANRK